MTYRRSSQRAHYEPRLHATCPLIPLQFVGISSSALQRAPLSFGLGSVPLRTLPTCRGSRSSAHPTPSGLRSPCAECRTESLYANHHREPSMLVEASEDSVRNPRFLGSRYEIQASGFQIGRASVQTAYRVLACMMRSLCPSAGRL